MILKLNRSGENKTTTFGTLSRVVYGNLIHPICNMIENSWENNKQDVSCIPKGTYGIVRSQTTKTTVDGYAFFIQGVPHRTNILMHIVTDL